jgi:hypothetical protein
MVVDSKARVGGGVMCAGGGRPGKGDSPSKKSDAVPSSRCPGC